MATASIINTWVEGGRVFIAASVDEGGNRGVVEYIGSVEKDVAFDSLTNPQKKSSLIAAIKSAREAQSPSRSNVSGITGTGTV